ncbi:MAG: sigma-54 dependent transcriptional regulator [Myxococcota bacterium]
MTGTRVLVVDDEENLRHMLSLSLSKDGYHVWTAGSGREGLQTLKDGDPFDICITDVRMPGMDGLAFIEQARRLGDKAPTFIAMSAYGDEKLAVEALRRGAFDYISKPFAPEDLSLKLRLVVERRSLDAAADDSTTTRGRRKNQPGGLSEIVSTADSMREIFEIVRKVARFPTTVLITGETGTGKERIAGAIHREGPRSSKPFVAVNCGAIPENLLESELFGYVKGAFTDAQTDREGLFEVADGGTLFLDEIAELPLSLQVKLLRALVEKEIRRVGDTRMRPVDVRVVAATARDITTLVKEGTFREDLFYRLNVVAIHLPPLRARRSDVPLLVNHFVEKVAARLAIDDPQVSDDAMELLKAYDWPGNVRELENAIERALVLSDGHTQLTSTDLDDRFSTQTETPAALNGIVDGNELSLKVVMPQVERLMIRRALEQTGGNRTRAATLLGISHRALLYKLKEHGIS